MSTNPTYYYDVVFPSSFTSSYVVNIESDAIRTFTVTNKTPSGFRIDSNSISPILDVIYWEANDLTTGDFGAFVGLQGPTGYGSTSSGEGAQGYQGPGFDSILSPAENRILTSTGSSTTSAVAQPNFTYDGALLSLTGSNFQITAGQSWNTIKSNGNSTANVTIDFNAGNIQSYTLNANTTFSFSNGKSGATYIVILTQGLSSFTASFASAKWSGGVPPVVTSTNNAVDVFTFLCDGTNYYGSYLQNY